MGKNKLKKFAENKTFDHVFEPLLSDMQEGKFPLKGKWVSEFFKNDNPLVLELGCGLGEYSVGLGKRFPEKNFVGVDIKGARIWRGAKSVEQESIPNVAFLRTRIDFISCAFEEDEVDEIWITFPDPQPQDRRIKKRLTSPMFMKQYQKILKPNAIIHLKTDSELMYDYTLEQVMENKFDIIQQTKDLYSEELPGLDEEGKSLLGIKTKYEQMFSEKGFSIKYLKFSV